MGIPWVKKFWSFCTLGRHGWRKNFPAALGGRQNFWGVPWGFDPQIIFFACPCMFAILQIEKMEDLYKDFSRPRTWVFLTICRIFYKWSFLAWLGETLLKLGGTCLYYMDIITDILFSKQLWDNCHGAFFVYSCLIFFVSIFAPMAVISITGMYYSEKVKYNYECLQSMYL